MFKAKLTQLMYHPVAVFTKRKMRLSNTYSMNDHVFYPTEKIPILLNRPIICILKWSPRDLLNFSYIPSIDEALSLDNDLKAKYPPF